LSHADGPRGPDVRVPGKVLFASWARRAELVPVAVTLATFDVTFAMRATKRPALSPGGTTNGVPLDQAA
jgi:hypothetical protein